MAVQTEMTVKDYSSILIESKNIILYGAPGTGKTYLAKEIAADIISGGACGSWENLSDAQKEQVGFVQFHPSYDYTDFVEGLRPKVNDDGSMGFELRDGVFKTFAARARKNWEDSKIGGDNRRERSVQEAMDDFFSGIELGEDSKDTFETINKSKFTITDVDEERIKVCSLKAKVKKTVTLKVDEIRGMLESDKEFEHIKDIAKFFGKRNSRRHYSYDFVLYKAIKEKEGVKVTAAPEKIEQKNYVFIIDEINRGEISKIFGELFFTIDPGYRGRAGEVSTQYANMHDNPDEKFYIPENVYIIGTMNDIDRSVDSFDFAMRRRFRFIQLKADERVGMLDSLGDKKEDAIKRMKALNEAIAEVEDLSENYQIGAAYFLRLKTLTPDKLWEDYLQPLLRDYIQGMYDEKDIMQKLADAYGYEKANGGGTDEAAQN